MSSRRRVMLPALRQGLEGKALTIAGWAGRQYALGNRTISYGMRDAAAGWDLDTVVTEGYERVVWVYKAVEIIAGNASRLPFEITTGDDEKVEKHGLLRVMNKQANPIENGRQFRKRLSQQVLLSKKGAFVEVTTSRAGQITRLDLLAPDRVRIQPSDNGDYVEYFEYTRPDGQVRNLDPSKVRWIREPHPFDNFSGTTPLEAAGMSVELDRLARAYNVNFINRDGRPGGIVGVDTEGLNDKELDRIANVFEPGVHQAGKITAIGTGKGGMNYIDTSARPRDMAYETTSEKAKKEILAAFGVPESIAGDASQRTFDNAAQETFTFWHEVMIPHLEMIASAFDRDVDEDADCGFDTSEVEALEMPARRRREEARTEVDKGLRSVDEYRVLVPDLEAIDNPQTRALWLSPAKAPVPTRPEDAAALGVSLDGSGGGMPGGDGGMPPGGPQDPGAPGGAPQTARDVVAQAIAEGGHAPAEQDPYSGQAAAAVAAAQAEGQSQPIDGDAAAAVAEARMQTKTLEDALGLPSRNFVIVPDTDQGFEGNEEELRRLELTVASTIEAMLNRQAGVVAARLQDVKTRKGTPYWIPESEDDTRVGEEPINAERVVNATRWAGEAQESLLGVVPPATQQAANDLLTAMAASGALVLPAVAMAQVLGRTVEAAAPSPDQVAMVAAAAAAAPSLLAVTLAVNAVNEWSAERVDDINRLIGEQAGAPDLTALVEGVRKTWAEKAKHFADQIAVSVAETAISGGRTSAAQTVAPQSEAPAAEEGRLVEIAPELIRVWRTREDEKVRATHRAANGQRRGVDEPFTVGGCDLMHPSDPLAPVRETRWCRCWLRFEWTSGAKFVLPVTPAA